MRILPLFLTALLTASLAQAQQRTPLGAPMENQVIPLFGHVDGTDLTPVIDRIKADYLGAPLNAPEARQLARAIVTYIGPDRVSNGRFVPPEAHDISEMELSYMAQTTFPDEGCHVRRLRFSANGDFIVLMVDATDAPAPGYHEQCLMLATLSALGEDMDNTSAKSVEALHDLAQEVVSQLR